MTQTKNTFKLSVVLTYTLLLMLFLSVYLCYCQIFFHFSRKGSLQESSPLAEKYVNNEGSVFVCVGLFQFCHLQKIVLLHLKFLVDIFFLSVFKYIIPLDLTCMIANEKYVITLIENLLLVMNYFFLGASKVLPLSFILIV